MQSNVLLICLSVLPVLLSTSETFYKHEEGVPNLDEVWVEGEKGVLPCGIPHNNINDTVILLLWYKEGRGTPIYSFDARIAKGMHGRQWFDPASLGARASLHMWETPSLHVQKVEPQDKGAYRCRIDYRFAATKNFRINVSVIVLPNTPKIFDEQGEVREKHAGPYKEGSTVQFICDVTEGIPLPTAIWYLENKKLDESWYMESAANTARSVGTVRNILKLDILRHHHQQALSCTTFNTDHTLPVNKTIILDLYLRPTEVRIRDKERTLSAGKEYELACESYGSRPPAKISWYKGEVQLMAHTYDETGSNKSESVIKYIPTRADNNRALMCRAENPLLRPLRHAHAQDVWTMTVHYPPIVVVGLGRTLSADDIKQGMDVYLDCQIDSNPSSQVTSWLHDDKPVLPNASYGVILSNQSLVFQSVDRSRRGNYRCVAENSEGKEKSQQFYLRVKYPPVCTINQRTVYGSRTSQNLTISCEVESDPVAEKFEWLFKNHSGKTHSVQESLHGTTNVSKFAIQSLVHHTVEGLHSFGELICWGSNPVGRQETPCSYQIVQAEPPQTPQDCIQNITHGWIQFSCIAGESVASAQLFVMEVASSSSSSEDQPLILANLTREIPKFHLREEDSLSGAIVKIYAVNAEGRSSPAVFQLPKAEGTGKVQDLTRTARVTSILAVLLGTVGALGSIACIILTALRIKVFCYKSKRRKKAEEKIERKEDSNSSSDDEKSPDLIPDRENKQDKKEVVVFCRGETEIITNLSE